MLLLRVLLVLSALYDVTRASSSSYVQDDKSATLSVVGFGSCNDQSHPQAIWPTIQSKILNSKSSSSYPLWLFLGDNIYADERQFHNFSAYVPPPTFFKAANASRIADSYNALTSNSNFSNFQNHTKIIGTWDDHDFGINDGDLFFENKVESQSLFLDFLKVPQSDTRRRIKRQGVYNYHDFGSNGKSVRFILLDNRYFKSTYDTVDGDFLGDEQWTWLENALKTSDAAFNVIGSGIQVLPTDRPLGENWERFPAARKRLLDLIYSSKAKGVVLLSGDVHFAEMNAISYRGVTLTEITSSGLTHSWNNFRTGTFIAKNLFRLANWLLPFNFRLGDSFVYGGINFGTLTFDWPKRQMIVGIHDQYGNLKFETTITSSSSYDFTKEELSTVTYKPIRSSGNYLYVGIIVILVMVIIIVVGLLKRKKYKNE